MGKTTNEHSPEEREHAVRPVLDNQSPHESRWPAIVSISATIGCAAKTLNARIKSAEVDRGNRAGITTQMADRLMPLARENREVRQANEFLRKASAYFTQAAFGRRSGT